MAASCSMRDRSATTCTSASAQLLGLQPAISRAIPTIEDRVDIGCGACILGNVTIGHDSLIGANAVVVTDIPPYSTAVGIPARVIKRSVPGDAQP